MARRLLLAGLVLAWLMPPVSLSQEKAPPQEPRLLTFGYLQKGPTIEGPFRIGAYVVEVYKCPPCPAGAQCKPCIGDHIVVTDNPNEKDPKFIRRLRIFADRPDHFRLKTRYMFEVTVRGKTQKGHPIEDVNLISFDDYIEVY